MCNDWLVKINACFHQIYTAELRKILKRQADAKDNRGSKQREDSPAYKDGFKNNKK